MTVYETLTMKPFEKNVGKGENAGRQHFLIFQKGFQKATSLG